MTDRRIVAMAFRNLRRQGISAKMNYSCCQSCATASAPQGPFAYYHAQDHESAFIGRGTRGPERRENSQRGQMVGALHVRYCVSEHDDAEAERQCQVLAAHIIMALRTCGFGDRVQWDGDTGHTIKVLPATRAAESRT